MPMQQRTVRKKKCLWPFEGSALQELEGMHWSKFLWRGDILKFFGIHRICYLFKWYGHAAMSKGQKLSISSEFHKQHIIFYTHLISSSSKKVFSRLSWFDSLVISVRISSRTYSQEENQSVPLLIGCSMFYGGGKCKFKVQDQETGEMVKCWRYQLVSKLKWHSVIHELLNPAKFSILQNCANAIPCASGLKWNWIWLYLWALKR